MSRRQWTIRPTPQRTLDRTGPATRREPTASQTTVRSGSRRPVGPSGPAPGCRCRLGFQRGGQCHQPLPSHGDGLQTPCLTSHVGVARPITMVIGLRRSGWRRSADQDRRSLQNSGLRGRGCGGSVASARCAVGAVRELDVTDVVGPVLRRFRRVHGSGPRPPVRSGPGWLVSSRAPNALEITHCGCVEQAGREET